MYEFMQHQTVQQATTDYIASKLIPTSNNNSDDGLYNETHSNGSTASQSLNTSYMSYQSKHIAAASMASLSNIGNTCYLNSVVYTLRFAPYFLHNLHHLVEDLSQVNQKMVQNKAKSSSLGRNVGGIPGPNTRSFSTKDLASMGTFATDVPRTQRQIATEKLHELYNSLRRNELNEAQDPFQADTFLSAVQDVSSIFEGNQQQDAHEFLMCILDSIRETCQSLTKVITDCPDIIMNGYVSVPEKHEIIPSAPAKPSVRLPSFFQKRSKEDKSKQNHIDSMSKYSHDSMAHNSAVTNDHEDSQHDKDKLNQKISERIKQLGLDFFTEDFEGVTVSSTKCLSCETITEQKETMIDLSVPITGYENIDTTSNPDLFIQNLCITREHFNNENKYRCEVCTGLTEAIRTISYPVLPRLLIIQLKRFSGGMEKINSYIPTPFTMQCFCSKCCAMPDGEKFHVYKLYSVITHVGATLSVGHYIAYTCALDGYNNYYNCSKDKRKTVANSTSLSSSSIPASMAHNSATNGNAATTTSNTEKNPSLMKKMFMRNKASSSGDVTKNMKNMNGSIKPIIVNGIEKIAPATNSTCHGLNCCGVLLKGVNSLNNGQVNGISDHSASKPSLYSVANNTSDYYSSTSTTTLNGGDPFIIHYNNQSAAPAADPTWYMCDDDKIRAMSQQEFEELLSPNKKITITPYLLFYARTDVQ